MLSVTLFEIANTFACLLLLCHKTVASIQIAKNEELYANSLANTCLKKLLAPNNGMDEFILQQVKFFRFLK